MLGWHVINKPSQIPEDYFNRIEAPSKQLIFFEDSGHGMIWEEAAKFHDLIINDILSETKEPYLRNFLIGLSIFKIHH